MTGSVAEEDLPPTRYGTGFYTLGEARRIARASDDYVIEGGILTKGGKLLLYAAPGAGKTTFLDHAAASLASGASFLGRFAVDRPRRVLFVQGELALGELASHMQNLLDQFEGTEAVDNLIFHLNTQLKLPRGHKELRDAIVRTGAEVLILDPFSRFFEGHSSTQPEEIHQLLEFIDSLLEDPELGVEAAILAHHMNVDQRRTAGSWAFEAWPSTIVRLDRRAGKRRSIKFEKVRSPDSVLAQQQLTIELGHDGYIIVQAANEYPWGMPRGVAVLVEFLRQAGGVAPRKAVKAHLISTLDIADRQVTNVIAKAVHLDRVKVDKDGREAILRLTPRSDPDDFGND